MHNADHVEFSLKKIREIFIKASERIEAIKPGDKIPATVLAAELGSEFGMTGPQLYPTIRFLLDSYPGVLVRRGAHGGILKPDPSSTKAKPAKASPVVSENNSDISEID